MKTLPLQFSLDEIANGCSVSYDASQDPATAYLALSDEEVNAFTPTDGVEIASAEEQVSYSVSAE